MAVGHRSVFPVRLAPFLIFLELACASDVVETPLGPRGTLFRRQELP